MSFILGTSKLGSEALGASSTSNHFNKYKVKIYNGTTWKTYKPVIINNITVPTNAIVDINDIPILTSDGEFILVDENSTELTAEYVYADGIKYAAYIAGDATAANIIYSSNGIVYSSNGSPIYY